MSDTNTDKISLIMKRAEITKDLARNALKNNRDMFDIPKESHIHSSISYTEIDGDWIRIPLYFSNPVPDVDGLKLDLERFFKVEFEPDSTKVNQVLVTKEE